MKKVLIAADEVDKWSRLCEGLQTEWECTTVNLDAFEKFHTIAVYDTVLIREKQKIIQKGKLLIDWCYHTVYWGEHELATLNEREKAFLYLLADSSRQVVTHEIIFEQLWKEPYEDDSANMIWCFLVTVPIISNKFLKVYRLTQEKSTNVRFLFVLFSLTTILFFIMLR